MRDINEDSFERIMQDVVSTAEMSEVKLEIRRDLLSPNVITRDSKVEQIVIHATMVDRSLDVINMMLDPDSGVSTHYIIGRDGSITQLVDDSKASMHMGFLGAECEHLIKSSIGIHIVGSGYKITNSQYRACGQLCAQLVQKHNIRLNKIIDTKFVLDELCLWDGIGWENVQPALINLDWKQLHSLCSMYLAELGIDASVESGEPDTQEDDGSTDVYRPQPLYMLRLARTIKCHRSFWQRIGDALRALFV